ncbi:pyridoxal phosphate-dependent aminotransferase [Clostridium sp. D2Q-14]|uniref:MalY/PatB family protein n=1 Tax=Anaeromonas gelatinilytica TaxID=2683194 RepID=UPI00193B7B42|nr:MalY/PatB family protein [Anaeromonas gelatinilytica]MBS4534399.1 pyridoxal phosphate-dependent aminotransferase [Anaeromonas gelatinilytica]
MKDKISTKYDFETIIDRKNSGSARWEQMKEWNPNVSDGIIPFSVADMELKNPPEIIKGLQEYIESNILGYTKPTQKYYDAVCGWMKSIHNWDIQPEWIINTPGVVTAFFVGIKTFTEPGDGVIIMPPVYYPFYNGINLNDRKVVKNSLIDTGKTYEIDYEDLENKAKDPKNKVLLFCSPHNPAGRVWRKEELERVADICLRNDVFIISDEIHNDLIMPGNEHTVFATISEEVKNNVIVCTAPSKTFNLAGVQNSNIIIPNEEIRERYEKVLQSSAIGLVNMMGLKACEIAYTECEDWLEELLELIHHNHLELKKYIEENIPQIKVYDLEGTYLQWLDFKDLGLSNYELKELMHKEAELFFDEGYIFGEEGSGFERWNIACPTKVMIDGLERLKNIIGKL